MVVEVRPPVMLGVALGANSGRLAGASGCGLMVGVVKGSDAGEEPTGWALVRELVREFVDQRCPSRPVSVRYLRCDGCGRVTPHSRDTYFVAVRPGGGLSATPREAVCDFCEYVQPRTVGDEVSMDATVTCVGRRYRWFGWGRSRRPCGRTFAVPVAASRVQCPWCATVQIHDRAG
jgi:hypothetical protein